MAVQANRENFASIQTPVRDVDVIATTVMPNRLQRISWGAIIAGIVMALVTMLALHMLGLSIGAATINPVSEANPIESGFGTGAVIWLVASNLIGLFVGGYVAGRFAGSTDDVDGVLHGLVTWAVVTLLTLYFLTTSVGNVVNGLVSAAGQVISQAGSVVADVSPEVASTLDLQNVTLQGIQGEVRSLLQQTGDPALQPEAVTEQAQEAGEIAQDTANTIAQFPTLAELELNRAVSRFLNLEAIQDTDRQDIVNILTERTNLTEEEARQTVDRWEQAYVQLRNEAEETARQVSQQIADAVTAVAGILFASMIVGAFAAGAGGLVGSPERQVVTTTRVD